MDIPRESEKNICPPATESTVIHLVPAKADQSGLNMNFSPSAAPGRVTLLIITITSIMNRAGMAIEENFSIPPETPPLTTNTVNITKMREYITVCTISVVNSPKYSALSWPFTPKPAPNKSPRFAKAYLMQYPPSME